MSSSQELSYKAGEATGQVQLKKEEYLDKNNPSLISQASNVIQQTYGICWNKLEDK
ncbi:BnaC03g69140D [Brassica napus]|uniref:BnaC03g69140D protein n=1 Tax=Brassica napus TaxID=3708 RepID=A0A078ICJ0_BRANA|nr:BnaC03g69140D [Brassica napus]